MITHSLGEKRITLPKINILQSEISRADLGVEPVFIDCFFSSVDNVFSDSHVLIGLDFSLNLSVSCVGQ